MSYFTKEQLTTIFTMQAQANSAMSDAWLTSTNEQIPYYRAAYMEASEAIGHLGFKWWKKETPNMEQAILELVDILHFASSETIRFFHRETKNLEKAIKDTVEDIIQYEDIVEGNILSIGELLSELEYFILDCIEYKTAPIYGIITLFKYFNCDPNKIYNMYVGKNALNLFRTKHGQRENTYIKIWHGKEDNYYLENYFAGLNGESVNIDNLNKYLEKEYKERVLDSIGGPLL